MSNSFMYSITFSPSFIKGELLFNRALDEKKEIFTTKI